MVQLFGKGGNTENCMCKASHSKKCNVYEIYHAKAQLFLQAERQLERKIYLENNFMS